MTRSIDHPFRTFAVVLAVALLLFVPAGTALIPGVPGVSSPPWGAWVTETVDDRIVQEAGGLAVGSDGQPRIAYSVFGAGIWVAQRGLVTWQLESVGGGILPDIVLAPDDTPHVSFSSNQGPLVHAIRGSSGWQLETVDPTSMRHSSIGLDGSGRVHIVYTDATITGHVFHAVKDGTTWAITQVDSGNFGSWLDAAVAPDGTVHAVYVPRPQASSVFRYAVNDGSGWAKETVSGCWTDLSIALDPQGRPHVVCKGPGGLHYHVRENGAWTSTVALEGSELVPPRPTTHVGLEPSIAIDANGDPHVSFRTRADVIVPNHLYYASIVDGSWNPEVVDVAGWSTGLGGELALDDEGRPAIASALWQLQQDTLPCSHALNRCFELRFARPVPGRALPSLS